MEVSPNEFIIVVCTEAILNNAAGGAVARINTIINNPQGLEVCFFVVSILFNPAFQE